MGAEVAINGAGFAGLVLARALAGAGVPVVLADRAALNAPGPAGEGRVFALSSASVRVLDALGLWQPLAGAAEPVLRIETRDGAAPQIVGLDHAEMASGPLGFVIEAQRLMAHLRAEVPSTPGVRVIAPAEVSGMETSPGGAILRLGDGRAVSAPLIVGADGRNSSLRRLARINVTEWRYDQSAIVTTANHELAHGGVAEERFLDGGAFAVLPMTDGADGAHRSAVIWTEDAARAEDLLTLAEGDFLAELRARAGRRLGAITSIGARAAYPLGLTLAESYIAPRLALIGDAAHAIHPVAGQGLNLGIRDAAVLAEVIVDARRLGLDIGLTSVLEDFQTWRRFDNTCIAAATDIIHRTFRSRLAPVRAGRRLGMAALNAFAPARRLFMREAMGIGGDLPRLIRGEPL